MDYKFAVLALVLGVAAAAPQYGYEIPTAPTSLYETPAESVQEPVQLYEAPRDNVLIAEPQNIVPKIVSPVSAPPAPMEGMPYDFEWGVQDQDSGNAFSHVENSDGQTMQGEYRVLLPDGRTQVVKFFDNGEGFNADVTYEK
ncbi:cuticle protein 18.6 isoform X1 [Penaeus vannamei]|uniref:cuticle protein 18.6 isoform X1 n=1 Tax=Penaeus vannamei TaxID=6689 RepID=UPI00387F395B